LNEAKAVAWRTAYPDLVFPVRATQQVQAVVGRDAKLQTLWRARYALWSGDPGKNRSHQQPRTEL
jgi:hypothetical protein